ncbi:hypothetical protein BH10PSE14_BH10PSE14_04760 [soil metagenome]
MTGAKVIAAAVAIMAIAGLITIMGDLRSRGRRLRRCEICGRRTLHRVCDGCFMRFRE